MPSLRELLRPRKTLATDSVTTTTAVITTARGWLSASRFLWSSTIKEVATAQVCLPSPWSVDSPGRVGGLPG